MSLARSDTGGVRRTYVRASVETLCAIASVEEECFALLDLGELVPQTFDLQRRFDSISMVFRQCELASDGATSGGRVAILDNTLVILTQRTRNVVGTMY